MFTTLMANSPRHKSAKLIRFSLTILAFLMSSVSHAEPANSEALTKVYKVVGDDGQITFSDQPDHGSETLLIAPVPTVPALEPIATSGKNSNKDKQSSETLNAYKSLSILSPANGSAFYSGSGEVDVIVDVQPALITGDKVQVFLDGKLIKQGSQLQFKLQTVARGTHQLQVKLASSTGKVIKTKQSGFTVHRPSIRN